MATTRRVCVITIRKKYQRKDTVYTLETKKIGNSSHEVLGFLEDDDRYVINGDVYMKEELMKYSESFEDAVEQDTPINQESHDGYDFYINEKKGVLEYGEFIRKMATDRQFFIGNINIKLKVDKSLKDFIEEHQEIYESAVSVHFNEPRKTVIWGTRKLTPEMMGDISKTIEKNKKDFEKEYPLEMKNDHVVEDVHISPSHTGKSKFDLDKSLKFPKSYDAYNKQVKKGDPQFGHKDFVEMVITNEEFQQKWIVDEEKHLAFIDEGMCVLGTTKDEGEADPSLKFYESYRSYRGIVKMDDYTNLKPINIEDGFAKNHVRYNHKEFIIRAVADEKFFFSWILPEERDDLKKEPILLDMVDSIVTPTGDKIGYVEYKSEKRENVSIEAQFRVNEDFVLDAKTNPDLSHPKSYEAYRKSCDMSDNSDLKKIKLDDTFPSNCYVLLNHREFVDHLEEDKEFASKWLLEEDKNIGVDKDITDFEKEFAVDPNRLYPKSYEAYRKGCSENCGCFNHEEFVKHANENKEFGAEWLLLCETRPATIEFAKPRDVKHFVDNSLPFSKDYEDYYNTFINEKYESEPLSHDQFVTNMLNDKDFKKKWGKPFHLNEYYSYLDSDQKTENDMKMVVTKYVPYTYKEFLHTATINNIFKTKWMPNAENLRFFDKGEIILNKTHREIYRFDPETDKGGDISKASRAETFAFRFMEKFWKRKYITWFRGRTLKYYTGESDEEIESTKKLKLDSGYLDPTADGRYQDQEDENTSLN